MELVEGDLVQLQSAQAALADLPQVLGPAVGIPYPRAGPYQPALGRDDQVIGIGVKGLGDELLADVGAIAVGCVDEVDPEVDGPAQDCDAGVVIGRRTPDPLARYPHGPKAHAANGQVAPQVHRSRPLCWWH